jgi:hypothetical protein
MMGQFFPERFSYGFCLHEKGANPRCHHDCIEGFLWNQCVCHVQCVDERTKRKIERNKKKNGHDRSIDRETDI